MTRRSPFLRPPNLSSIVEHGPFLRPSVAGWLRAFRVMRLMACRGDYEGRGAGVR